MKYLFWFILIAVALFFIKKFLNKYKTPKVGSIALFTGGVKCGKSSLAIATALSEYRARHRSWKFRCFFAKIFRKDLPEEPLLYSNVPLRVPYVEVTQDLIFRKKRFRFGSVIYIDEASLVADSQLIKDMVLNERLNLFHKLIGHSTHNGCLIYSCHTVVDNHYSLKRALSNYIYIHHLSKWIPFFLVAHVREFNYSDDDSSIVNAVNEDSELQLRKIIFRKSVWKKFDSCAWSILTDDLPVVDDVIDGRKLPDLKIHKFVSFRDYSTLPKNFIYKITDVNYKGDNTK